MDVSSTLLTWKEIRESDESKLLLCSLSYDSQTFNLNQAGFVYSLAL